MAKPEWGAKHGCPKCGTRFYDLGKDDPVTCIECGYAWQPEPVLKSKQPIPYEQLQKEKVTGDLDGQLTGRSDGQRLRLARLGQVGPPLVSRRDDPLDHRDAEAEGLAGAGLGLADDVVPAEGDRQRHGLDGEGVDDPEVAQRGDDVGVDAEVGEGGLGFLRHQRSHAKMSLPIGPRARRMSPITPRNATRRSGRCSRGKGDWWQCRR